MIGQAMIVAGLGFRKNCAAEDILAAIHGAAARAAIALDEIVCLCAPAFKSAEPALNEAAERLGKPLVLVSQEAMARHEAQAETRSLRVIALHGLPSVAETAALAGVTAPARLLGPRFTSGGAACALAISEGPP